jgi:hypothetical protein
MLLIAQDNKDTNLLSVETTIFEDVSHYYHERQGPQNQPDHFLLYQAKPTNASIAE